jgi:hypothetical protein
MSKRILITGNKLKDITRSIVGLYPYADTVSRSDDSTYTLDLSDDANIVELAKISVNYDIVINSALIPNFGQTRILQAVWTEWKVLGHHGLIINFGSAVDYYFRPDNRLYPIEKRALRDLNRSLAKHASWHDSGIKSTYFSFGGVSTDKTLAQWGHYHHFSPDEIAAHVKWIIDAPSLTHIDELHITPIQPEEKSIMQSRSTNAPVVWSSGDPRSFLITKE